MPGAKHFVGLLALAAALITAASGPACGQWMDRSIELARREADRRSADVPFLFESVELSGWRFEAVRLKKWMDLVDGHRPGELDQAAKRVAGWTDRELGLAVRDFEAARSALAKERARNIERNRNLALDVLHMSLREFELQDTAPVLKRAVLLHTDLSVETLRLARRSDSTVTSRMASFHFGLAMHLVEELGAEFTGDPAVRDWFLAVAALLQNGRDAASAPTFARRAVARFPDDPDLLLLAGGVHEFAASHRVQDAEVAQSDDPDGKALRAERPRALEVAEACFARALAAAGPSPVETRVHYGRVLGERGKKGEAVEALRPATTGAAPPPLRYLAWVLTGDNQAALGHAAEADAAYREAIALFPRAPSGRFAFSAAARRRGDHQVATESLALQGGPGMGGTADPWNGYFDVGRTRDVDSLLASLRGRLAERR